MYDDEVIEGIEINKVRFSRNFDTTKFLLQKGNDNSNQDTS